MMHAPNLYRIRTGQMGSDELYGNNGAFDISPRMSEVTRIVSSDQLGWEHVSVSHPHHIPTWSTMCIVKSLFWDPEDLVMQIHPPQSEYVNCHPYCLHLWRPSPASGMTIPKPPMWMVGK